VEARIPSTERRIVIECTGFPKASYREIPSFGVRRGTPLDEGLSAYTGHGPVRWETRIAYFSPVKVLGMPALSGKAYC